MTSRPAATNPSFHSVALDGADPVAIDDVGAAAVAKVLDLYRQGRASVVTSAGDDLTTSETARSLGVSREWVTRLVDSGALRGYRVGSHRRIPRDAVEEYLRSRDTPGAAPKLQDLRRRRQSVLRLVGRAGGGEVRVFGSVARGEAQPDSDVDLFVDLPTGTGLMKLAGLEADLSELLGRTVDVIPTSVAARSPHLAQAFRESVAL